MNIKQILNLKETHPIEKAVLIKENKVFDSILSEDEMQSLADHFVNISRREAMKLWSIMGAGMVENTVALHQAEVNGRSVSDYIIELLTSEDEEEPFREEDVKWQDPENRIKYMNEEQRQTNKIKNNSLAAEKEKRIKELGSCPIAANRRTRYMTNKAEAVERFKQLFGSRVKED